MVILGIDFGIPFIIIANIKTNIKHPSNTSLISEITIP